MMVEFLVACQYLAALALVGIALHALIVINEIHGACPRPVALAWVGLLVTSVWLAIALLAPEWTDCRPVAMLCFCVALLAVFLVDRYGRGRALS